MEHKVSYYIQGVALNGDTCRGEMYKSHWTSNETPYISIQKFGRWDGLLSSYAITFTGAMTATLKGAQKWSELFHNMHSQKYINISLIAH